ncbi:MULTISPECIES: glycosyltransferase [unclassified Flavobacterium]|uniref:glycosyltransferase n=1 Tax=unclassified Flavobacterium TaxID=196869 RepID=UPI000EAEC428|nr:MULTISPECIES: glycosyltransferase [unclassified Flavobacterium]RKS01918.1 glycosyltransferase involved in cell wall biosynthesis [Flavobacterium sp. 102]
MRVVQIIDSLEVGGAEKMAINYANALSKKIEFSGLVATRAEGHLKRQLSDSVSYLFLKKTKTLDFKAAFHLKKYCKTNKVEFLQPHSSSYFTALLVKIIYPKIKIIWHDHNGLSEFISTQKSLVLKIASFFFKGIIVVNYKLKDWAEKELNCKKVVYFPNFTNEDSTVKVETLLKGIEGKRILCLANLRDQKNHFLLLNVAEKVKESHSDWTFHLVGKDFEDDYSKHIFETIANKGLENTVFIYGSKNDVVPIINQVEIAILTSKSEGLPVALIEYGLCKKPVVSTNVGEIPLIIKNRINGFIVGVNEVDAFYESLLELINSEVLREQYGEALHQTILKNHSEEGVITQYLNWIKGF